MNLPEIKNKIKVEEKANALEPIKSYSSTKLIVTPYHKIENVILTRYASSIEKFKKGISSKPLALHSSVHSDMQK